MFMGWYAMGTCDFSVYAYVHSYCECKEPLTQIMRSSKQVARAKSPVDVGIAMVGLF